MTRVASKYPMESQDEVQNWYRETREAGDVEDSEDG